MKGIQKIIKDVVRAELKLHDEYKLLKEDVEFNRKRMWEALHKVDHLYMYTPELNEIMKKSNEATYKMYEGWFNDAVKKLKEFEEKHK